MLNSVQGWTSDPFVPVLAVPANHGRGVQSGIEHDRDSFKMSREETSVLNKTSSLTLVCIAALSGVPAVAQNAPIIRQGVVEVGGFVGASYGIDQTRIMGGGNVVYSLTRTFMPFAEVSYFPGIGRTQSVTGIAGGTESFSIPLLDFNAGFHIRIPIPKSRIIPYAVVSVGGIHTPQRNVTASIPDPVNPGQFLPVPPFQVNASTDFAVSGGAGLRYYATERLGFRVEFKAYRPTGTYTNPFYRVAGGFFYQF
jgi:hypothetical protein